MKVCLGIEFGLKALKLSYATLGKTPVKGRRLYQGDIMISNADARNGIIDPEYHWPNATIPFHIVEKHFSSEDLTTIMTALKEYNTKTCVHFKPYNPNTDKSWIYITGNETGCWSYVGMQGEGGQQVNVETDGCVYRGIVMHELLHASGFEHEQSTPNRDEYVKILWDNIQDGYASDFAKMDASEYTDYGTGYDYGSLMHYGRKDFSKNGLDTIETLQNTTEVLGLTEGFSTKDIQKLNIMYKSVCNQPQAENSAGSASIVDWIRNIFDN